MKVERGEGWVNVTLSERNLKRLNELWADKKAGGPTRVAGQSRLDKSANSTIMVCVEADEVHYAGRGQLTSRDPEERDI